jgi:beta-glucanase (GH16 family)
MTTYYNYLGQAMPVSQTGGAFLQGSGAYGETLHAPAGPSETSVNGGEYDTIIGSNGDNIYDLDDTTNVVQVADGLTGIKSIVVYASGYVLPANVNNLTFYGAGQYGVGNTLNNLIVMGGNDSNYMDGGAGNDVLVGGFGQNTIGFHAGSGGNDVVYNFHPSQDTVRIAGASFTSFAQIQAAMTQTGADVVLRVDASDSLTFRNVHVADFTANNFLMPLDASKLGALTFDDEFNNLQLFDFSTGQGHWRTNFGGDPTKPDTYTITSNDEKEVYTDASFQGQSDHPLGFDPFSVNSGVLSITAQNMGQESQYAFGQPYSSGMLNTKGIFMQKYGYFEMRAELPTALGSWPAFWLSQDPYKPGVEADILEHLAMYPNIDFARANNGGAVTGSTYYMPDTTGLHTYGMLWTPTTTTFYVDSVGVMQMPTPASWDQPMYMILNLAVGGWGGVIDDSAYPAKMNVDYVRVYGLADNSQQVVQETPAGPAGTLSAAGAAIALAGSGGWTDAKMLADGELVMVSAVDSGYGSHKAAAMIYNPGSGAQIGSTIDLFGYAPSGATMDPHITVMPGSFWKVSYAGSGAPEGYEIYTSAGQGAFFDNQYTEGTPIFTPLSTGGHVVTNTQTTSFAVVQADGTTNWFSDPAVHGAATPPSEVHALTNGGFYFTYAGQSQIDVFDPTGAADHAGHLGAPVSSFAMASDAMQNGQFAVAWLSQPADGSFNMALTFQTFDSNGAALTQAAKVATDADPWHTELKVIATSQPGDALLLWSQGGAINGAYAHGATIDPATPLIVGNLDDTTQTALSDGHILLTWLQTDNGVQNLWSEILDPSTMTGVRQELGTADGQVHVIALDHGAYAASWHLGGQIEARGYDGSGHYGPTTTVAGDFVARDISGDLVSVYHAADGSALLQHYVMTDYFSV